MRKTADNIIKTEGLSYIYSVDTPYEHVAVDNVNIEIERGAFVGLIGHTGSGKSTLIQHLNGLLRPTSGKIYIGGEDIWSNPKDIRRFRFKVGDHVELITGVGFFSRHNYTDGGTVTHRQAQECLARVHWKDFVWDDGVTVEDTQFSNVYDPAAQTLTLRHWADYDAPQTFTLEPAR